MALILQSRRLRRLRVLVLVLLLHPSLVASDELENRWNPANVNEIKVERNATISLFRDICSPSSDKYLSSNFTLAPEVCLSGHDPHNYFKLLEMPRCVDHDRESRPAMLVTYSDEKCTGPAIVQPSPNMGPSPRWWIEFPFPLRPGSQYWSLIFHCHTKPFDKIADPFKRVYTTGGKLQDPLKPRGPLALCEHRPPRLTDGLIKFVYEGCNHRQMESWKAYQLPTDTCQSTGGGKGLKLYKAGTCVDDSRARMARYWDNDCKDLHDINDIKDEDFALDACQLLNYTTRQVGSIAFYCDGSGVGAVSEDVVFEATMGKEMTLLEPTPKLQPTPLPPKPWVPFWKGMILVDRVEGCSGDDRYINPEFEVLATDSCYTKLSSPLKIFQVSRCFNFARANIAFFTWTYCKGSPIFYDGTDEKLLDTSFCMSTSNGYNSMAFWCEGTGPPWQYLSPGPQKHYLPSYSLKKLLLIGELFAVLILVSRIWSMLRIKEKIKVSSFGSIVVPLLIHNTGCL